MAENRPNKKKNKPRRFYDYSLLFTVIFLTVFGLVMIYSSSSYAAQIKYDDAAYFMMRQAKIALAGFVIMLIFMAIGKKKPKFNEFALGLAMLAAIFIAQAVRVM